MFFRDVVGQEEIKTRLIHSVRDQRVPHAMLFLGPEGHGGLPLAIAFARYLNCRNRTDSDACGHCPSCLKISRLIHPDLHFVFPVVNAGSKEVVSDMHLPAWREAVLKNPYLTSEQWMECIGAENKQGGIFKKESDEILRKLSVKSFESEYKVMIIWMAEKLNVSTANKLLKIFEEPPEKTLFILIASASEQMLPTILSRMQIFLIPQIEEDALYAKISGKENVSPEMAGRIVKMSAGNFSKALVHLSEGSGDAEFFDYFVRWMRLCWSVRSVNKSRQMSSMLELIHLMEELSSLGRERIKQFLSYSIGFIRENLLLHWGKQELVRLDTREQEFSAKFSTYIHQDNVFRIIDELSLAYEHIESNGNEKIVMTDLVLRLIRLIK